MKRLKLTNDIYHTVPALKNQQSREKEGAAGVALHVLI